MSDVAEINEFDYLYELILKDSDQKYSDLFSYFEKIGLSADLIEVSSASLEDVFLHMTGRRIRD